MIYAATLLIQRQISCQVTLFLAKTYVSKFTIIYLHHIVTTVHSNYPLFVRFLKLGWKTLKNPTSLADDSRSACSQSKIKCSHVGQSIWQYRHITQSSRRNYLIGNYDSVYSATSRWNYLSAETNMFEKTEKRPKSKK